MKINHILSNQRRTRPTCTLLRGRDKIQEPSSSFRNTAMHACICQQPSIFPGARADTNKSALRSAWTVQCYLSSRGEKYGAHLDPIAAYPVLGACIILRELTQAHLTMMMDLRLRRLEIPRPHASPFRSLAYIYTHQL